MSKQSNLSAQKYNGANDYCLTDLHGKGIIRDDIKQVNMLPYADDKLRLRNFPEVRSVDEDSISLQGITAYPSRQRGWNELAGLVPQ
jgi:hypothetical protein